MSFDAAVSEMDAALLEAFGEQVSYERTGEPAIQVRAVFFNGSTEFQGNDVVIDGQGPHFVIHRDGVPAPVKGDFIERENGDRYIVARPMGDEKTLVYLRCRKV